MIKPQTTESLDELSKLGVYILDKRPDGSFVSATVAIHLPPELDMDALLKDEFNIAVRAGTRGIVVHFDKITYKTVEGQKQFQMRASVQHGPKSEVNLNCNSSPSQKIACTFADMCYFTGSELIDEKYNPNSETSKPSDYAWGDIGWVLPCRLIDPLVLGLGKFNDIFMEGFLTDSIVLTGEPSNE